jgi:prolycopene isomerase
MGVRADVLPPGTDVHHILIEDWGRMEEARHTLFVSIPTM